MNADGLRPRFHFTPQHGWMNDPNGLVRHRGEYHLCYQYNPASTSWADICWGHAVSSDLLAWRELDVALRPHPGRVEGSNVMIFSGSTVADRDVHGVLTGRLRAYYTAHEECPGRPTNESVGLAWSDDDGRTWRVDDGSPVLDPGRQDFRDPKVLWFAPDRCWVMVIADPDHQRVEIHRSVDGRAWELASAFTRPHDDGRLWECPDLFPVPITGSDEERWLLVVSTVHPAGRPYTATYHWIGRFDGTTFTPDHDEPRLVDHGKDHYAGVTFGELDPGEEPVMLAWASDWAYAWWTPAEDWRGAMALPRRLWLERTGDGLVLCQRAVDELEAQLRPVPVDAGPAWSTVLDLHVGTGGAAVRLDVSGGEHVEVGIDAGCRELWVDRRSCAAGPFHPTFPSRDAAPLPGDVAGRGVELRVVVDGCVLEVFAAGGRVAMTELIFPSAPWIITVAGDVAGLQRRDVGKDTAR